MAFASPANDYVESRLTPEKICGVGIDTQILDTSTGFAVIEPVSQLVNGQVLLVLSGGRTQFAWVMGKSLIFNDGETMEGSAAEEVNGLTSSTVRPVMSAPCRPAEAQEYTPCSRRVISFITSSVPASDAINSDGVFHFRALLG